MSACLNINRVGSVTGKLCKNSLVTLACNIQGKIATTCYITIWPTNLIPNCLGSLTIRHQDIRHPKARLPAGFYLHRSTCSPDEGWVVRRDIGRTHECVYRFESVTLLGVFSIAVVIELRWAFVAGNIAQARCFIIALPEIATAGDRVENRAGETRPAASCEGVAVILAGARYDDSAINGASRIGHKMPGVIAVDNQLDCRAALPLQGIKPRLHGERGDRIPVGTQQAQFACLAHRDNRQRAQLAVGIGPARDGCPQSLHAARKNCIGIKHRIHDHADVVFVHPAEQCHLLDIVCQLRSDIRLIPAILAVRKNDDPIAYVLLIHLDDHWRAYLPPLISRLHQDRVGGPTFGKATDDCRPFARCGILLHFEFGQVEHGSVTPRAVARRNHHSPDLVQAKGRLHIDGKAGFLTSIQINRSFFGHNDRASGTRNIGQSEFRIPKRPSTLTGESRLQAVHGGCSRVMRLADRFAGSQTAPPHGRVTY